MDREILHFEPDARTVLQRWWRPVLPAVIGVVLAVGLVGGLSLFPEPTRPWQARCMDPGAFEQYPSCSNSVPSRFRKMNKERTSAGLDPEAPEVVEERARGLVIARSQRLELAHARNQLAWARNEQQRRPLRWFGLLPLGLGGLASILLVRRERRRGVRSHRLFIDAHSLTVDGRRVPWSEVTEVALAQADEGMRLLRITDRDGLARQWRLPAHLQETAELERLLVRVAPSPEDERAEASARARILAEKQVLDGRAGP